MDELQAKHRKELRDLQARITQKKKAATKKTRKGVNDECTRLEEELKARHAEEIAASTGAHPTADAATADHDDAPAPEHALDQPLPPPPVSADANAPQENLPTLPLPAGARTPDQKKPNRQKARLARRAAEQARAAASAAAEAAAMPDARARERAAMLAAAARLGLREREVRADGHCLYAAVADQRLARGAPLLPPGRGAAAAAAAARGEGFRVVRGVAADYMAGNGGDFLPFLEEGLDSYVAKVRDTAEWGGQIELLALAKAYGTKISVLQGDGSVVDVGEGSDEERLWVAYYRHGFGLGEHYNSLRKET
jgi:OTU domain-containing protein 6